MESVLLAGLNPAQKQAVTTTEGAVRVIAGAGSGKTRALTHRFAYLVSELGIPAGNILCATFTNKAAQEMKARIRGLVGDNDTAYVCTFHSFCVSVLNEESHRIHYPQKILVLDNSDINTMLETVYEERGLTARDMTFKEARDMIELCKNRDIPEYYLDLVDMSTELLHEKYRKASSVRDIIFYGYLYQQKKCFGLDYNDLILLTLHVFRRFPEARQKWQERLEYIMVDEFQDIDALQYELLSVLSGYHGNLFVVGDPDQTIYTWRGADIRYLLDLEKDHPGLQTILMNDNYRSTPQILAAANRLISRNRDRIEKELVSHLPDGEPVLYHHAVTGTDEAEWICRKAGELIASGTAPGDICVLFRTRSLTRSLETVFLNRKLPYRIYSGVQFFDRREIKDALSYLRLVAFRDDLSFARVINTPRRNFGRSRMERLRQLSEQEGTTLYTTLLRHIDDDSFKGTGARSFLALVEEFSALADSSNVSDLFTALLEKSGLEKMLRTEGDQEKLDDLAELKQLIADYETGCGEELDLITFLERIALFSTADEPESRSRVRLMTIHAAKGLEFPYVFLCGLNENLLPSKKTRTYWAMEEERRLCFVAFTRAQKGLFLSDCEGSTAGFGFQYPSRFLLELGQDAVTYDVPLEEALVTGARSAVMMTDLKLVPEERTPSFREGERVRHAVFGCGTVLRADPDTGKVSVRFDGLSTPRTLAPEKLTAE